MGCKRLQKDLRLRLVFHVLRIVIFGIHLSHSFLPNTSFRALFSFIRALSRSQIDACNILLAKTATRNS